MPKCSPSTDIASVIHMHGTVLRVRFADGVERVCDVAPLLVGPVFEQARMEPAGATVNRELGTIEWAGGDALPPSRVRELPDLRPVRNRVRDWFLLPITDLLAPKTSRFNGPMQVSGHASTSALAREIADVSRKTSRVGAW